jgi:hypothetical protein
MEVFRPSLPFLPMYIYEYFVSLIPSRLPNGTGRVSTFVILIGTGGEREEQTATAGN